MRHSLVGFVFVFALVAIAATDPPVIDFQSVSSFFRLPPNIVIGEAAGVATTTNRVYIFSRGNVSGSSTNPAAAQLLEFDNTGRFIREIAPGAYAWAFAHAVRVDRDGGIWALDSGSDMVVKLDRNGQVSMVLGRRRPTNGVVQPWQPQTPLPPVDGLFRQPADITWDAQGNIYVADGHINSRIAKFDKDGKWVKSFGKPGTQNGEFKTPHSIVADESGNVFVGDAGNRRIQVFDTDGKYLRQFKIDVSVPPDVTPVIGPRPTAAEGEALSGTPWAMCITPPPNQVLFVADSFPGRIYKINPADGSVLGVLGESGRQLKQFGGIHGLACPGAREIYVAELLNWRVQRLILLQ